MRNATLSRRSPAVSRSPCLRVRPPGQPARPATTPPSSTSSTAWRSARARATCEHVRAIGIARYIDEQLHPERLADAGMEARLAGLQTLRMTSREIAEQFEIPQLKARLAKKRRPGRTEPATSRTRTQDPNPARGTTACEPGRDRAVRAEAAARGVQRAAAAGSAGRFLVQPLQRRRTQRRRRSSC